MDPRSFSGIFFGFQNKYFDQALKNARWALGSTWPNPSVGAVIVKDDQILAEGHTHPAGGFHAEAHALSQLKSPDEARGATLYVTLEPCRHHGRTPPCTQAIICAGIERVVYGSLDPNPLMAGQGIDDLKKAGIICEQVESQNLVKECDAIIAPFKKSILHKKPYIILKIATSNDDKVTEVFGKPTAITNAKTNEAVHNLRRSIDAILVGGNTVITDDPLLNARLGTITHGKQPVRVIVQGQKMLSNDRRIFDKQYSGGPVWLFHDASSTKMKEISGVKYFPLTYQHGRAPLLEVLSKLAEQGITSLLVEPGPKLFAAFLEQKLADEILWLKSAKNFNNQGVNLGFSPEDLKSLGYEIKKQGAINDDHWMIFQ